MDKLIFKHKELNLDRQKNFLTVKGCKELYSTMGYISLGNPNQYYENAKNLAQKVIEDTNTVLFFLTLYDNPKPFAVHKTETGEFVVEDMGYFNFAKDVFKKFNWGRDMLRTGLIEEVTEGCWEVIED